MKRKIIRLYVEELIDIDAIAERFGLSVAGVVRVLREAKVRGPIRNTP